MDFVTAYGWWQQPPKASGQKLWTYHPVELARWGASQGGAGGAEMGIYDVNGDKLNDVVTRPRGPRLRTRVARTEAGRVRQDLVRAAHDHGQRPRQQRGRRHGSRSRTRRRLPTSTRTASSISSSASVTTRTSSTPIRTTGERPCSTSTRPCEIRRPPGGAEFVPELIHNRSGVGSHFDVGDLNKDGTADIVTSGASGTFIFFNNTRKGSR